MQIKLKKISWKDIVLSSVFLNGFEATQNDWEIPTLETLWTETKFKIEAEPWT